MSPSPKGLYLVGKRTMKQFLFTNPTWKLAARPTAPLKLCVTVRMSCASAAAMIFMSSLIPPHHVTSGWTMSIARFSKNGL